jgi:DNA-binding transcriptional regulator YdaS (Cro superfamily)
MIMTTISPIQAAIKYAGGQTAVARICGVTPQAVNKWLKKGRVPSEQCLKIELAIDSKVSCNDLRPDVFGAKTNDPA